MQRKLRISAIVLLCVHMVGCARLPWEPPPERPQEQQPEPGREPEREPELEPEPPPAPDPSESAAEPAQAGTDTAEAWPDAIATGIGAIAQRRRELAASQLALDPDAGGYFMDVHEARLLQMLGDRIRMRREGSTFRLLVTGGASFETGSARPLAFLEKELRALAGVLAEFDHSLVIVHAHTDARGDEAFNRKLSERRALRVAKALAEQGVDRARLVAVGHGEADPVADNDTASGRARNRRVEIVIEAVTRAASDAPKE